MKATVKLLTMILAAATLAVSAEETCPAPAADAETALSAVAPSGQDVAKPKRARRTRVRKAPVAEGETEPQAKPKRGGRRTRKCTPSAVDMGSIRAE